VTLYCNPAVRSPQLSKASTKGGAFLYTKIYRNRGLLIHLTLA